MSKYKKIQTFQLSLVKDKTITYQAPRKIDSAYEAAKAIQAYLYDKDCENFVVVMLDACLEIIGIHTVAIGGIASVQCSIRDVFKAAIVANARRIVLGRNHPSGNVTPSEDDATFTLKAIEAGKLIGVQVLDHVIVSHNDQIYSFTDNRVINVKLAA